MINDTLRSLVLAALSTLLLSCASSEQKQPRPELIEQADKTISSGVYSYNQSDYTRAEELFTRALYRYRGIDNPEGIAASCINLARTKLSLGDANAASQWIDSAQLVMDSSGLGHLENHVAIVRSSIAIETEKYDEAKSLLAPMLDDADKSIDQESRLAALQNRTRIAFAENSEASMWTERYAEQVTPGEPLHMARLARFRAALASNSGARNDQFNTALDLYRDLAYRPGIAATLTEWSQHDIEQQQYKTAENKLERALYIRANLMDRHACNEILGQFALIYSKTGDQEKQLLTRRWIELTGNTNFNDWLEFTESYSGFPPL